MKEKFGETWIWPEIVNGSGNNLPPSFLQTRESIADICGNLISFWEGNYYVGLTDHGTDHTNREYYKVSSWEEALTEAINNSRNINKELALINCKNKNKFSYDASYGFQPW